MFLYFVNISVAAASSVKKEENAMFRQITVICKIPTEEIIDAQNFNFAIEFFQWGFLTLNVELSDKILPRKNFRSAKIYTVWRKQLRSSLPLHGSDTRCRPSE